MVLVLYVLMENLDDVQQITTKPTPSAPLDGITLATIVTFLVDTLGWAGMARAVPIRCFSHEPSIQSSLKFLRRTPWARQRVEQLFLTTRGSP